MNAAAPDPDGFVPPPYPYDRLDAFAPLGAALAGGLVDLSIGTPCDPPPASVVAALSSSNAERGYPPSIGTEPLRGPLIVEEYDTTTVVRPDWSARRDGWNNMIIERTTGGRA